MVEPNTRFNLINPVVTHFAGTTMQNARQSFATLRTDLKVKLMLDGRLRRKSRHIEVVFNYVRWILRASLKKFDLFDCGKFTENWRNYAIQSK